MAVKVLMAPTWDLAEPIEAEATVEAEYGEKVKEGTKKTYAHHSGKYKGGPAVSTIKPPPLSSGTILVSHLDLDTVITCLDLMGLGDIISESFRAISGFVDVKGPHRMGELDLSKKEEHRISAWWEYNSSLERKHRDKVLDVTEDVKKAGDILGKIMGDDPEQLQKGKSFLEKGEKLDQSSFVGVSGNVLIRNSNQFVNNRYTHDNRTYKGISAFNSKSNSVTISLEKPVSGVSCSDIVQGLWGKEAGGHDGIAGSPRGKSMVEADAGEAASALDKALKGKQRSSFEEPDWVGLSL